MNIENFVINMFLGKMHCLALDDKCVLLKIVSNEINIKKWVTGLQVEILFFMSM